MLRWLENLGRSTTFRLVVVTWACFLTFGVGHAFGACTGGMAGDACDAFCEAHEGSCSGTTQGEHGWWIYCNNGWYSFFDCSV